MFSTVIERPTQILYLQYQPVFAVDMKQELTGHALLLNKSAKQAVQAL
jgi:hypothetical protein